MIENKVVYIKKNCFFYCREFDKHAFNVRKLFFTLLQNIVVKQGILCHFPFISRFCQGNQITNYDYKLLFYLLDL